ncbi:hypothetical protein NQZ68_024767 [Dissostichus eleginoides]|nr:hypothetical protein NQZ68_024767 [Dissostichus eleginoides]
MWKCCEVCGGGVGGLASVGASSGVGLRQQPLSGLTASSADISHSVEVSGEEELRRRDGDEYDIGVHALQEERSFHSRKKSDLLLLPDAHLRNRDV